MERLSIYQTILQTQLQRREHLVGLVGKGEKKKKKKKRSCTQYKNETTTSTSILLHPCFFPPIFFSYLFVLRREVILARDFRYFCTNKHAAVT